MNALNRKLASVYLKGNCSLVERREESEVILNLLKFLQTQNTSLLTGPEIGLFKKAAIIRTDNFSIDLINPEIVALEDKIISLEENCASFPGDMINCVRYNKVVIQNGLDKKLIKLEGLASVLVQHAVDHLSGVVFFDRSITAELVEKGNIIHYL